MAQNDFFDEVFQTKEFFVKAVRIIILSQSHDMIYQTYLQT